MSVLPHAKHLKPADWERERLSRWLQEWALSRRLAAAGAKEVGGGKDDEPTLGTRPRSADGGERRPMAGQIRLLFPDEAVTRNRLVYVAVLDEAAGGFSAAPYSRFAEPAFEGEVLTGREAACLRVLCVWNTMALSRNRLERSWFVDVLSESERRDADSLRRYLRGEAALTSTLARRCGAPLRHPADPRAEYRERERFFAAELCRVSPAGMAVPVGGAAWPEAEEGASFLMAADPGAPYGSTLSFGVPEREAFLRVTALAGGEACALRVTDRDGRPTPALDGCRVQSRSGRMSRPIMRGEAVVSGDAIYGGFTLLTEKGETLPVRLA